jgi:AraC-like DNA-binding protein
MEIGYCREGYGILSLDDKDLPYEPGMISVIPRNYPHTTNSESGTKSYWEFVFLDPDSFIRMLYPENEFYQKKLLQLVNKDAIFGRLEDYQQLAGIVVEIMEEMRYKKKYYIETVKGLTTAMIYEIARINDAKTDQESDNYTGRKEGMSAIGNALNYISLNYAETIKIQVLAEQCNMSETHFRRLFTEYMRMTPVDYINMIRIQMACELMKKSDASMNDIAIKCGFVTSSTFDRNFKRVIGVTPYQWKKNPENYESKLLQFHISAAKGW